MSNVIQIKPCVSASESLRRIADMMDNEEVDSHSVTVITGVDVFQCGEFDDARAAENAVFNMTMGLHKLMRPIFEKV